MTAEHLAVDRIRCDGRGLCADLVPELIRLDEWGYPIIDPGAVQRSVREHAARAVASCPVLALRLERRVGNPPVRPLALPVRARL